MSDRNRNTDTKASTPPSPSSPEQEEGPLDRFGMPRAGYPRSSPPGRYVSLSPTGAEKGSLSPGSVGSVASEANATAGSLSPSRDVSAGPINLDQDNEVKQELVKEEVVEGEPVGIKQEVVEEIDLGTDYLNSFRVEVPRQLVRQEAVKKEESDDGIKNETSVKEDDDGEKGA